jgi:tetratricopeptide (TPR) repeat protein
MKFRADFLSILAIACLAWGCTKAPGAKVRDEIQSIRGGNDPERLTKLGEAYRSVGDMNRAAQYFALAIEMGGDEKKLVPRVIEARIQDKQYRLSIALGEEYLRKHPEDVSLRFVVASLHGALSETDEAKHALEQVLRMAPQHPEAHYAMAVLMRDQRKDLLQADVHFREYLTIDANGPHAEEARGSLLQEVK